MGKVVINKREISRALEEQEQGIFEQGNCAVLIEAARTLNVISDMERDVLYRRISLIPQSYQLEISQSIRLRIQEALEKYRNPHVDMLSTD